MIIVFFIITAICAAAAGYLLGKMQSLRQAAAAQATLEAEREHAAKALKTQAEALRTEFRAISADIMRTQSESLRRQHTSTLEQLLKPLEKDIDTFYTQFVKSNSALNGYIDKLVAQAATLGKEADNLAKALKGDNKMQGNWGEAVLANLLAASGLTEGRDFTLQHHVDDGQGSVAIPDVIVHLPQSRNIIIDSKVSLTAYSNYVAAEGEIEQRRWLNEHVKSVMAHVKELAAKDYSKVVPHSIGYVLLFIPNEGAYVAAVAAHPQIASEAYQKHIIVINPTNLLMALQLAYNLWQAEMQNQSVKDIFKSADKLYKKFSTFAQNFVKIGASITRLQQTYTEAHAQLATGRGNIVSQLEKWREKGLDTTASLPPELTQEE